ncbi:MAG TPA: nuclear transport factor 2 family protein [Gammaproteobacteria bacterium]
MSPLLAVLALFAALPAFAQEPVVGVDDPESLFTDDDPQLHENKQAALHIMRELLQCNHWDDADQWLTERYLQHNPNVGSGRAGVVAFFTQTRQRTSTCDELTTPVVAVLADGDVVTVVWPMRCRMPFSDETYSSTWFDMWRFVDGKADEHWDPAMRIPTGCQPGVE